MIDSRGNNPEFPHCDSFSVFLMHKFPPEKMVKEAEGEKHTDSIGLPPIGGKGVGVCRAKVTPHSGIRLAQPAEIHLGKIFEQKQNHAVQAVFETGRSLSSCLDRRAVTGGPLYEAAQKQMVFFTGDFFQQSVENPDRDSEFICRPGLV